MVLAFLYISLKIATSSFENPETSILPKYLAMVESGFL
jgi:hypothetical protein